MPLALRVSLLPATGFRAPSFPSRLAAKPDAVAANKGLQAQVDEANALLKTSAIPFDQTTLDSLNVSATAAVDALIDIPALPERTADIIKSAEKLVAPVDFADESASLEGSIDAYIDSVKQQNQIIAPSESFVVGRLQNVSTATGVQAVTEDNDPNGNLNKAGGCTASVYFSDSQVSAAVTKMDTVDRGVEGGGCVEVYASAEDAEKRNTYLSAFDGNGIFNPGSHKVYGTTVIRTSEHLTASQQTELENQILAKLIELKWSPNMAEVEPESLPLRVALQRSNLSLRNQAFLAALDQHIDISETLLRGSYIKVSRRSEGSALQIHSGYTNGFRSEDEIVRTFGDVERWPSQRFDGAWGVTHPDHGAPRSDNSGSQQSRQQVACPHCFTLMALSGVCGSCE